MHTQCFPPAELDTLFGLPPWPSVILAVALFGAFSALLYAYSARKQLEATPGTHEGAAHDVEDAVGETGSAPRDAAYPADTSLANPNLYSTALHEAAHALYYGVSPEGVPPSLYAEVYRDIGANGGVGSVGHHEGNPQALYESFLLWHMRKDVAGTEAQWVVFGERYAGGSADSALWLECATCYLSSGLGEVFYPEPQSGSLSASQLAHNRAVLNTLRERCQNDAQQFLTANQEVLLDLAEELAQRLRMEADDLGPFLARVREPEYSERQGLS